MSVLCLALAKFDTRQGYTLQWTSPTNIPLHGLEAKMLPSGIHQYESATVYMAHEAQGQLLYGTACFRQTNGNSDGGSDRSKVQMCSLGVLMAPPKDTSWAPHRYSAVGWEHVPALDAALSAYLQSGDAAVLEKLHAELNAPALLEPPGQGRGAPAEHPLAKLPQLLNTVGPLLFPLYKAALLRRNIMIFGHSAQGTSDLISTAVPQDPASCGALALVLALISVVPKDLQPGSSQRVAPERASSTPLYSVGLADVDANLMGHHQGYVASTTDEILKYQKQLYDVALVMPAGPTETCQVVASSDWNTPLKATFGDYCKFIKLYSELPHADHVRYADDSSSVHTSNSIFSALRLGSLPSGARDKLSREPAWWFCEATSPMSWREYVWSAFAWFASAGTSDRRVNDLSLAGDEAVSEQPKQELAKLVMLVGQFHKLTKKWFLIVDEIVAEAQIAGSKITLELTFQDVVDMELDPYSREDLAFLTDFVLTYWGGVVEDVEIGLGIHGFFC